MLSTQHIDTLEEFEALASEWDALVLGSHFAAPMLLHDWACCWFKTYGTAYSPAVITVREDGRLVAAAPLCRRRVCVGPAAVCLETRTLGAAGVAGLYFDFLVHKEAGLDALPLLLQTLLEEHGWNRLRLERMVPGSLLYDIVQQGTLFPHLAIECREDVSCPILALPDSMEALEAGMDPIFRTMLHRKNLKLAPSRHAVEFIPCVSGDCLEADLQRMFEVHTLRWTQAGHAGEFAQDYRKQFFAMLAPRLQAKGLLRFSKLLLDGEGHCYLYGVQLGEHFFGLQTGISPEGLACHAGVYNMYHLMESLLPTASWFHFMEGGEAYKYKWGATPQMAYTAQAWRGLRGHMMHQLSQMRRLWHTMRKPGTSAMPTS